MRRSNGVVRSFARKIAGRNYGDWRVVAMALHAVRELAKSVGTVASNVEARDVDALAGRSPHEGRQVAYRGGAQYEP